MASYTGHIQFSNKDLLVSNNSLSHIYKTIQSNGYLTDPEDCFFVYSADQIVRNVKSYKAAFEHVWKNGQSRRHAENPFHLSYSLKANYNPNILKLMIDSGLDYVTTVSGNEMKLARQVGIRKMILNGTGKKRSELAYATNLSRSGEADVLVNIDSQMDVSRLQVLANEVGPQHVNALIRFNPDMNAVGDIHPYVATALNDSKFGLNLPHTKQLISSNADSNVNIVGVHVHLGSTIKDIHVFQQAVEQIKQLLSYIEDEHIELLQRPNKHFVINVGGGLGINYERWQWYNQLDRQRYPQKADVYDSKLREKISSDKCCSMLELVTATEPLMKYCETYQVQIIFEPGRSLIADTGILCAKTLGTKTSTSGRQFLISDISMNECIRPCLYNAYHHVATFRSNDSTARTDQEPSKYDVVGPVCESADFVGKDISLLLPEYFKTTQAQESEEAELVTVFDVGAYCGAMSSNYNLRMRPVEVMVCSENGISCIGEKECLGEIISRFRKYEGAPSQPPVTISTARYDELLMAERRTLLEETRTTVANGNGL